MREANEIADYYSASGPGSAERQAEALREEGVEVTSDSMGEFYIDFGRFGWFPAELPSEVSEGSDGDDTVNVNV